MNVEMIGVVVIGRNEGERLKRCLASIAGQADCVVYVDSGSTDGSVSMARDNGVDVVELDMSIPFTAARARNEGFRFLRSDIRYVQFVDGDCEVVTGWFEQAAVFLQSHPDVGVVCGRRRERFAERSIYNLLCDIEWDTPIGEANACGGDSLMRADAFAAAGGFRDDLIAGEEPELCVRLRAAGWKIWRLDKEMTLHDAAMTRFGQWWKRTMRGGHAYAEGAFLHGGSPERRGIRESRRIWFWAAALPVLIAVAILLAGPWGSVLLAVYPAQVVRLALRGKRTFYENLSWAFFNVLGKFPELIGQMRFHARRLVGGQIRLIEYK